MKAKHSVWKNKLVKATLYMTVILVAALFLGSAATAGITTTSPTKPNEVITASEELPVKEKMAPDAMHLTDDPVANPQERDPFPLGEIIVYDNGDTDGSNGLSCASRNAFGYQRANLDDFVIDDPEGVTVNNFHAYILWNSLPPGSGWGWELQFWSDAGGVPGSMLINTTVTSYAETATGRVWFSRQEARVDYYFEDVYLPAGTYWIWAHPQGPENCFWMAHANTIGSEMWIDWEDYGFWYGSYVFGAYYDLAFWLTYEAPFASIHVDKQIYVPMEGYPADWTLTLEDTFGDSWNGGYLDVYVNGVLIAYGLTVPSGYGPEYFVFTVNSGDVIFVDYTYGSYPGENHWWLTDHLGNVLFDVYGGYDYNAYDRTVNAPAGTIYDADTPEDAIDYEICTIVQFIITVTNDGDFPIYDIWVYDVWDYSLEFVDAMPFPAYLDYGIAYWWDPVIPYELLPGESIEIIVWMHVVGPHCSIDENYVYADAYSDEGYVYDEDSAFIHCVDAYHIDIDKKVLSPVASGEYTLTLMDTYGDSWNGGYLDVYVNGILIAAGLTVPSGYGPTVFTFIANYDDVIFVDYTYGSYPGENHWWLTDPAGNVLFDMYGGYDDEAYDMTVIAEPMGWVETGELGTGDTALFRIIVTNDGMNPLTGITVYDEMSDSLEFVDADPYPEMPPMNAAVPSQAPTTVNTAPELFVVGGEPKSLNQPVDETVVWDNGMVYGEGLAACQYEPSFGELGTCADDFFFEEDTDVSDVHWIGGFWNGNPGIFDWEITFYYDDGSGMLPGAIYAGPYYFANAECNEQFLELMGTSYFYSWEVYLPDTLTFSAGVKYWVSFCGYGVFPPQSGMAYHTDPLTLSEMAFKSVYFGYPTWVPASTVFGGIYDLAFQLTHTGGEPPEGFYWNFDTLAPGESTTIYVWATVVGQPGETDENYVEVSAAEGVFASDSAYVFIIGATGLNVEKYVRTRGAVAEFVLTLEDTFGDGWNGGYLDVYVNGVLLYDGITIPSGYGPESYIITVADGDEIFVDYTYGSWASENHWWLTDHLGNVLFDLYGGYDYDAYDRTVIADTGEWVEEEDYAQGDTALFLITIANEGLAGFVNIDVFDYMSDSLEFLNAEPYPDDVGAGYLYWYFPGLPAGEVIEILVWATVVGNIGDTDENWAEAYTMGLYDWDTAYVHIVDLVAPVTTHEFAGTLGENDWYVSPVEITLTATDDYAGVDYTMYDLDGAGFVEYTGVITVTEDGEHDIAYYSVDAYGNVEEIKGPFDFKIDQVAPETTHTIAGTMGQNDWYISDVTITLAATDETSGVNEIYYKLDSGAWTVYTEPVVVATDGQHQFSYNTSDNAGNMEGTNGPVTFKIDKTAPEWISYTFEPLNALKTKWLCTAEVEDATSGIVIVEFYVDDALVGNATAEPYELEWSGKPQNNSQALAYDAAGNSALSPIATSHEFGAYEYSQQQFGSQPLNKWS